MRWNVVVRFHFTFSSRSVHMHGNYKIENTRCEWWQSILVLSPFDAMHRPPVAHRSTNGTQEVWGNRSDKTSWIWNNVHRIDGELHEKIDECLCWDFVARARLQLNGQQCRAIKCFSSRALKNVFKHFMAFFFFFLSLTSDHLYCAYCYCSRRRYAVMTILDWHEISTMSCTLHKCGQRQ